MTRLQTHIILGVENVVTMLLPVTLESCLDGPFGDSLVLWFYILPLPYNYVSYAILVRKLLAREPFNCESSSLKSLILVSVSIHAKWSQRQRGK